MVLILLLACGTDDPAETGGAGDTGPATADHQGITRREDGWLRGDLHMHTTWSDGWDDLATVVALGEYLADPVFVAAHPEYEGNGLDFLSITDHRTVDGQSDPAYVSSQLILVGGEEFGSSGHAGTHGIHEFVDHDADDDGVTIADLVAAIEKTHELGGTFSPNHPMLPDIPWPWDTREHDGVEVWNSGWSLMSPANTLDNLANWEASHGEASPLYRRALEEGGANASEQALDWYEAQLTRGLHLAVIGGSDRHAVLLPGFPTTWVRAASADEAGVVEAIRARHTFVSRTPTSAQVSVLVTTAGGTFEMGDEIPLDGQAEVTVTVRVGRADGATLTLVGGGGVDSDEAVLEAPLGAALFEAEVEGDDFAAHTTLTVRHGDWFYPLVTEPLVDPGLDEETAASVREFAALVAVTGEEDFLGLATLASAYVDANVLFDGSNCDPAAWDPAMLQCLPPDDDSLGSFYVPDHLDRALNVVVEDGVATDRCMGAVGSAVRFVEGRAGAPPPGR